MPTAAANFRQRLEAIRGVWKRYRELLPPGTNPYSSALDRQSGQFDKLADDVANVLGRQLPAKKKFALHPSVDRLNSLLGELQELVLGSWRLKARLNLEQCAELSREELERVVQVLPEEG